MKKLLILLLIVPIAGICQTKEGLEICILSQELSSRFSNSTKADEALDKILSVVSLAKNFTLVPCDKINNAQAWSYKGERYILYDKAFMKAINSKTNNWSNLTILAHEVGHHLNNHTIDLTMLEIVSQKSKKLLRKQELEADEFAGNIMAKLGAPINEVLKIGEIFLDGDDTYSTHPSRSKRIASLTKGYNKGNIVVKEKIVYVESKKGISNIESLSTQSSDNNPVLKKLKAERVLVKCGDWFREDKKGYFTDDRGWHSFTKGEMIGQTNIFLYVPLLQVEYNDIGKPYDPDGELKSFDINEYARLNLFPNSSEYMPLVHFGFKEKGFVNINYNNPSKNPKPHKGTISLYYDFSIINSKGEVILNGTDEDAPRSRANENEYRKRKFFINSLKKGSKLLIKPSRLTIWDGNGYKPNRTYRTEKISDFNLKDIIFVYSLKGSSEAIPFKFTQ